MSVTTAQIEAANHHLVTVQVSTLLNDEAAAPFEATLTGFLSTVFTHDGHTSFHVTSGRDAGLMVMDFEVLAFTDHGERPAYLHLLASAQDVLDEAKDTVTSAEAALEAVWATITNSVR